jgi:hypothetical protein
MPIDTVGLFIFQVYRKTSPRAVQYLLHQELSTMRYCNTSHGMAMIRMMLWYNVIIFTLRFDGWSSSRDCYLAVVTNQNTLGIEMVWQNSTPVEKEIL